MFETVGLPELLIIGLVIVVLFGAGKLGHLRVRHAGPNAAELAAQLRTTSACSFAPTLQFAWASATVLNVRCLSEVRRW